jgi:hypothetical protein
METEWGNDVVHRDMLGIFYNIILTNNGYTILHSQIQGS